MVSLFIIYGCSSKEHTKTQGIEVIRMDVVQINDKMDQAQLIYGAFDAVDDELGIVYGIDYRKRLPYRLSLKTGEFQFLSSTGSGPKELRLPSQLSMKDSSEFYVYDTNLDKVARFVNDELIEKTEGFLKHNVWLRNPKGYYWNHHIITAIKEPENVNVLDFENARPIAMLNLSDSTLTKHGKFSSTIDHLDQFNKYPMIVLSREEEAVYYVFYTDYSIMKYDIKRDTTYTASTYRPSKMRERTVPVDPDNPDIYSMARIYGLDISQVVDIVLMNQQLVVVWYNATDAYYDNRSYSPEHLIFFGVVYDLPDLSNPREFTLPGKFLGTWGNRLLIEENDDVMEYTIGFYEFVE
ncbi:MAG: hypothetical protein EA390_08250 [Balneolaceae bacterium]|nr:MAG: hypothetical protein EA390_08250 [Balneolaceae bacterium]